MAIKWVQFQRGLSLAEFLERYGVENRGQSRLFSRSAVCVAAFCRADFAWRKLSV